MSTLQHTLQPALRHPRVSAAAVLAALATVAVILIVAIGGSTAITAPAGPQAAPSQADIQRQLESVAGPRYGIQGQGVSTAQPTTQREPEGRVDARFHRPAPTR